MTTVIKSNIEFGKKYTDKNTGFTGVAVCISKWQYGCIRVTLQPYGLKEDGDVKDSHTFDEEELIEAKDVVQKDPGGPRPEPVRRQ